MDKILISKKYRMLGVTFMFGIAIGCIYFNILWRVQGVVFKNEWSMLLDRFIHMNLRKMIELIFSFWHVYFLFHILICVLGPAKIGKIVIQGMFLCGGILTGVFQTLLLLSFEVKVSLLFLLKILIVLFPYWMLIGNMMIIACTMSSLRWISENKTKKWKNIQWKRYGMCIIGTLMAHVVYIIFVSYVNFGKINLKFWEL